MEQHINFLELYLGLYRRNTHIDSYKDSIIKKVDKYLVQNPEIVEKCKEKTKDNHYSSDYFEMYQNPSLFDSTIEEMLIILKRK